MEQPHRSKMRTKLEYNNHSTAKLATPNVDHYNDIDSVYSNSDDDDNSMHDTEDAGENVNYKSNSDDGSD